MTNPGIWEALGLPLTPFLDSELSGRDVKKVTEKNVQPYQIARVTLVDAETGQPFSTSEGSPCSLAARIPSMSPIQQLPFE